MRIQNGHVWAEGNTRFVAFGPAPNIPPSAIPFEYVRERPAMPQYPNAWSELQFDGHTVFVNPILTALDYQMRLGDCLWVIHTKYSDIPVSEGKTSFSFTRVSIPQYPDESYMITRIGDDIYIDTRERAESLGNG